MEFAVLVLTAHPFTFEPLPRYRFGLFPALAVCHPRLLSFPNPPPVLLHTYIRAFPIPPYQNSTDPIDQGLSSFFPPSLDPPHLAITTHLLPIFSLVFSSSRRIRVLTTNPLTPSPSTSPKPAISHRYSANSTPAHSSGPILTIGRFPSVLRRVRNTRIVTAL